MSERTNCGYTIIQSIVSGDIEIVLGHNPKAPNPYVTWKCKNGDYYYWGHYFNDRHAAECDLLFRADVKKEKNINSQPKNKQKEYER